MDHVPGIGPHRVGMVTPSVGSPHNPTQFGSDSTLDAVSRHCEKELRCPIQSCLDAIKHCVHFRFGRFGDELLFGAQTYVLYVHFGSRPKWTCKVQHKGFVFFSHPNLFKIFPPWYGVGLYSLWMVLSYAMSIAWRWRDSLGSVSTDGPAGCSQGTCTASRGSGGGIAV